MIPCSYHPDEPSVATCDKCDNPICVVCKKSVQVGAGSSHHGSYNSPLIRTYCRVCAPKASRGGAIAQIVFGLFFAIFAMGFLSVSIKGAPLIFKIVPVGFMIIGIVVVISGIRSIMNSIGKEQEELTRSQELKSKPMEKPLERPEDGKKEEKPSVVFQVEKYFAGGSIDVKDSVIQRSVLDVGAMEVPSKVEDDPKNLEAYTDALKGALSDGIISDSEEKILRALRKHFNITEEMADNILEDVIKEMSRVSFRKKDTVNVFEVECPGCSSSFKVEDTGEEHLMIKCASCGLEGEL